MKAKQSGKPRVVVIGAYNADLMITCKTPLLPGKSLLGGPMQIFGGGRGANCAIAAARADCSVTFVGAHGRDGFGGMAQGQLASENINLDYFAELPYVKTGTSLSLVEANSGQHYLVCAESANDQITPGMIQSARDVIASADLVISELEIPPNTVWEVMQLCEQKSIPLVLDISPVNRIDRLPCNQLLLVVSESIEEAMRITRTATVPGAITELHRLGSQNVVLVDGHRAVIYSDRNATSTAQIPIEQVVDRCGGTECLETWLAISLLRQIPLADACREAVLAMAHSLSRLGGHQSMPRRSEIASQSQLY